MSGEFVQILHTGCSQWNVTSTILEKNSKVDVYDRTNWHTVATHTQQKGYDNYIDVQKQPGAADCRIFTIALATACSIVHQYQLGK